MNEKLYIDVSRCKGCGYCINACPKNAIYVSKHINENGYNSIDVDRSKCVLCGNCYKVCPDYVFEIR
ncbi:4Fe-4S binding protein [Treponema socranskii]|uniref:4Fe-4S binding protein n=1 Tax=Treponema socranskii TaxID=53419 RepID=UPI0035C70C7A